MNIDISEWNTFKISDLFDKVDTGKKKNFNKVLDVSEEQTDEFDLPLVNAKHGNNGIMYYGRSSEFESEIMTLGVVQNGAIATGNVYAHIDRTGILGDAYLIKPKFPTSRLILLFMACVVQKAIKQRFSYDDKAIWDKVKEVSIMLPVTQNHEPDWLFMEDYMHNIELLVIKKLDNLESITEERHAVNINDWKRFKLGGEEGLFNIVKGKRLTKADMIEGDTPFIGSSTKNNGITNYIGNSENIHEGNLITVAYNGSVGQAFYQKEKFIASDDVNVFYPKFDLNEDIAMFLCPLIKKTGERFKYIDKWKKEDMETAVIKLPVNEKGTPNWQYMEEYIRNIKRTINEELNIFSSII